MAEKSKKLVLATQDMHRNHLVANNSCLLGLLPLHFLVDVFLDDVSEGERTWVTLHLDCFFLFRSVC